MSGPYRLPVIAPLETMRSAGCIEYELTDKEARVLRSRIYSLNKNHVHGHKWRTMKDGSLVLVWRIR